MIFICTVRTVPRPSRSPICVQIESISWWLTAMATRTTWCLSTHTDNRIPETFRTSRDREPFAKHVRRAIRITTERTDLAEVKTRVPQKTVFRGSRRPVRSGSEQRASWPTRHGARLQRVWFFEFTTFGQRSPAPCFIFMEPGRATVSSGNEVITINVELTYQ